MLPTPPINGLRRVPRQERLPVLNPSLPEGTLLSFGTLGNELGDESSVENNLDRAHHYRDETAHLRLLAGEEDDPQRRESLLSIATSYDKLYVKYLRLALP